MKKPTLEEVKEYFKNATRIKVESGKHYDIDTERLGVYATAGNTFRQCGDSEGLCVHLWDDKTGYSKIIKNKVRIK
jgi:hypothetical protein